MDPALLALVGSLAAALGGYLVATRRLSGRINTTEAADLWKESGEIRKWSQGRIDAQDAKIARLEERIDGLFKENRSLTDQIVVLKKTTLDQERTIGSLVGQLNFCQGELDKANVHIAELERKTNGP